MSKEKEFTYDKLKALMEQRSIEVMEKFGHTAVSGVNNPKLLKILEDVKKYWKDVYRPALTSLSCEAVGGKPKATSNVSLIITLVAAGMGIHDDILDKSLNKHSRSTILGLHGLDEALLVGDLLIVKALTIVRETFKENVEPEIIVKVLKAFETFFLETCEAELIEVSCRRNLDTELEDYQKMLWLSMADIEACGKLGAILGGGAEEEIQALAEFGRCLGFLTRLENDIVDCRDKEGDLRHRLEHESIPLPILYAAKSSKPTYQKIKAIFEKSPIEQSEVNKIGGICLEAGAFTYMLELAEKYAEEAKYKLQKLRDSGARDILELLINATVGNVVTLCFQ